MTTHALPHTRSHARRRTRLAGSALAALAALSLSGCGGDTTEEATSPDASSEQQTATMDAEAATDEDVLRLDDVADDLDARAGEELTVAGAVKDVITPEVFTIVDPTGTTLDPVLVVGAEQVDGLAPEQAVQVTGTVKTDFDVAQAEETLDIQLEDELLTEWQEGLYIEAQQVDTGAAEES